MKTQYCEPEGGANFWAAPSDLYVFHNTSATIPLYMFERIPRKWRIFCEERQ